MYSYDVAAAHRPPTTNRSIPGMRPSYDAEHPSSATPIYDGLYSEYRRLFRALPGDRSGEEDLRFTGFAVRDPFPARDTTPALEPYRESYQARDNHPRDNHLARETYPPRDGYQARDGYAAPEPYLTRDHPTAYPQQQTFHTYPGHAQGTPQFMPTQQQPFSTPGGQGSGNTHAGDPHTGSNNTAGPDASSQASAGQGWVATGYLAPASHTPPGPTAGRHRSMLSLPSGRVPGQG
ncbi:hypothetical protein [Kitasatospora sp. McL0602]|uniref:hypothetical protein n=1 Tax=Kitasatospora sp. McL0602 TaxID=3439530 RepID=UPI003F8B26F2